MGDKLLVLYTGGTIGMQPSAEGYIPMVGLEQYLRQALAAQTHTAHTFPVFDFYEFEQLIDSANLVPEHWQQLATKIQQHWHEYNGFVVLHGTDTMAYSASALSFIFQHTRKAIIFTGAQIPLVALRSDALDNLLGALLLASSGCLQEVALYFHGCLLRGNRSAKVNSNAFAAFDSPNYPLLARAGIDFTWYPSQLLRHDTFVEEVDSIPSFQADAVAVLLLYPGIPSAMVQSVLSYSALRAVVLMTYGAGNPPDANQGLMQALAEAAQRGVVLLNMTQCRYGAVSQGVYASGSALSRIGVIAGGDMTLEASVTKLHYLVARYTDPMVIKQQLGMSLCGEITPDNLNESK